VRKRGLYFLVILSPHLRDGESLRRGKKGEIFSERRSRGLLIFHHSDAPQGRGEKKSGREKEGRMKDGIAPPPSPGPDR